MDDFLKEKFMQDRSLTVKNLLDKLDPEFLNGKAGWKNTFTKKTEKDVRKKLLRNKKI